MPESRPLALSLQRRVESNRVTATRPTVVANLHEDREQTIQSSSDEPVRFLDLACGATTLSETLAPLLQPRGVARAETGALKQFQRSALINSISKHPSCRRIPRSNGECAG